MAVETEETSLNPDGYLVTILVTFVCILIGVILHLGKRLKFLSCRMHIRQFLMEAYFLMTGIDPMKESVAERTERHRWSSMDEVSDPDKWMELHHIQDGSAGDAESEIVLDENGIGIGRAEEPIEEVTEAEGPSVSSADPFERMTPAEREAFKDAENQFLGFAGRARGFV